MRDDGDGTRFRNVGAKMLRVGLLHESHSKNVPAKMDVLCNICFVLSMSLRPIYHAHGRRRVQNCELAVIRLPTSIYHHRPSSSFSLCPCPCPLPACISGLLSLNHRPFQIKITGAKLRSKANNPSSVLAH
jgi:hypothetical protein